MRVLFDNSVPRGVASVLREHVVEEARDRGWDRLTNGDLLRAAEDDGFEVLLTTDRNVPYQQNLSKRIIAIVVLSKGSWPLIKRKLPEIGAAVAAATPGSYTEVEILLPDLGGG